MADRHPFLVITDAAKLGDDGVAIAMLLADPTIDVKLIVCASGNVWAPEVEANVQELMLRLKHDVPICYILPGEPYPGRVAQFTDQAKTTKINYSGALSTPLPSSNTRNADGYRMLFDALNKVTKINLFISGPSTPFAMLLREEPGVSRKIGEVFVMGGALDVVGNATEYAEFNFWFDPQAASTLLSANLNVTLVPLDATKSSFYSLDAVDQLRSDRPAVSYLREYLEARRIRNKGPFHIWDEALSAVVLRPTLVEKMTIAQLDVVKIGKKMGKLKTVHDGKQTKIKIVSQVNTKNLEALVLEYLSR